MPIIDTTSTPSGVLVYPKRQRCRKCRRYFGWTVLDRLYCSYECAGWPRPSLDVLTYPRMCRCFSRTGEIVPKRAYFCIEDVDPSMYDVDVVLNFYHCTHCRMYHLGRNRENVS